MYQTYFKRVLDLFFAVMLLLLTSWIFILIRLLYWLTFQQNMVFIHPRIGKNEETFNLFKFRTLKEVDVPLSERRFLLGDFLRFTSLDELPQLINVVRGEMSLIGPRPLPVDYLPLFSAKQKFRHAVRPGISGLAQVSGRHSITWKEKFEYDYFYIHHLTFALDVKIAIKTILLLLSLRKDVSLDEKKFLGSNE